MDPILEDYHDQVQKLVRKVNRARKQGIVSVTDFMPRTSRSTKSAVTFDDIMRVMNLISKRDYRVH